ncbi:AAA family ATPase [Achromobacter xylosoxidans]|uniref:AAA family ATPase n=1 Tax=Achromobacter ruhlandii TaxID=72557 RepID=UPI001466B079|nr:AAA family ATPase [Achromobacter ruhlandii]CAB3737108.1 hypothetical protein LMG1866_05170 [Achromobacter ruhlandii]
MAATIVIKNLKHIRQLEFSIPGPGVHLLTGANGSGKTSLLACLLRIGKPNAFPLHFRPSSISPRIDNFDGAAVTYACDGRQVTYTYGGTRWVPRPKSGGDVLDAIGFSGVNYVGATAERITPRPEEVRPNNVQAAPPEIIAAANRIFGTSKFTELRTINVTRGVQTPVYLLQKTTPPGERTQYYTERNFSLGELCVIKLIKNLMTWPANSLVLIDELEIALHPRAQIELHDYLQEVAEARNLTIIFSTHSVSLIKSAPRSNLIFLEARGDEIIRGYKGCFPTYILGSLAHTEERVPDKIIYVEDEAAEAFTSVLVDHCLALIYPPDRPIPRPSFRIVPLGTYDSVLRFVARQGEILPQATQAYALLDQDVQTEVVPDWQTRQNYPRLEALAQLGNQVKYLPTTPEVGLIDYLVNDQANAERALRIAFNDPQLTFRRQELGPQLNPEEGKIRRQAKVAVRVVVDTLAARYPALGKPMIRQRLYSTLAKHYFNTRTDDMIELVASMLS